MKEPEKSPTPAYQITPNHQLPTSFQVNVWSLPQGV